MLIFFIGIYKFFLNPLSVYKLNKVFIPELILCDQDVLFQRNINTKKWWIWDYLVFFKINYFIYQINVSNTIYVLIIIGWLLLWVHDLVFENFQKRK